MTTQTAKYLLDANVFIEAHRHYYAFDICPGFWECLLHYNADESIYSIEQVRKELASGDGRLSEWIKDNKAKAIFLEAEQPEVAEAYSKIMNWVKGPGQFKPAAANDFAAGADGWLIAYAQVNRFTVVTHEVYSPEAKKKVPMPNVCKAFGVDYLNTFSMLSRIDVQFNWHKKNVR